MTDVLLAVGTLLQPAPTLVYRIDLAEAPFRIESPRVCLLVRPEPEASKSQAEPREILFRAGDRFCVWQDGGLRTRAGHRLFRWSFLADGSVEKSASGDLSPEPRRPHLALSGSVRDGNLVYLLIRWEGQSPEESERLYVVDLSHTVPQPRKLAESPGRSLAREQIGNRLHLVGGRPTWIVRSEDGSWGFCSWDPLSGSAGFVPMGQGLQTAWTLSQRIHFFLERSSYGTFVFGRVDLLLARRRELVESRLPIAPLSSAPERYAVEGERILRDLMTGASARLQPGFAAKATRCGVLAWWPRDNPDGATLLESENLMPLASWSRR